MGETKIIMLRVSKDFVIPETLSLFDPKITEKMIQFTCSCLESGKLCNEIGTDASSFLNEKHVLQNLVDQKEKELIEMSSDYEKKLRELRSQKYEEFEDMISEKNKKIIQLKEIILSVKEETECKIKEHLEKEFTHKLKEHEETKNTFVNLLNSKIDLLTTQLNQREEDIKRLSTQEIKLDELNTTMMSFKSSNTSKGNFGETCVRDLLNTFFPKSTVEDISKLNHNGDIRFIQDDVHLMFEVKNKKETNQLDITKFENDIITTCHDFDGYVMVSSSSNITKKGEFELNYINDKPIMYVSKIFDQPQVLNIATTIMLRLIHFTKKTHQLQNTNIEEQQLFNELNELLADLYSDLELFKINIKAFEKIANITKEELIKNKQKIHNINFRIGDLFHKYEQQLDQQLIFKGQTLQQNNTLQQLNQQTLQQLIDIKNQLLKQTPTKKITHKHIYNEAIQKQLIEPMSYSTFHRKFPNKLFEDTT